MTVAALLLHCVIGEVTMCLCVERDRQTLLRSVYLLYFTSEDTEALPLGSSENSVSPTVTEYHSGTNRFVSWEWHHNSPIVVSLF